MISANSNSSYYLHHLFIHTCFFPPSSEDLMMETDHHSPQCPDATDLMRGLIQELSSLKSVNLLHHHSLVFYPPKNQSVLWVGALHHWRKKCTKDEMCFGFSCSRKVMAAHRELESLHRSSKGSRSSLRWRLMWGLPQFFVANENKQKGFSCYQQHNCPV